MAAPLRGPLRGPLGRIVAGAYGVAIGRINRGFDAGRGVVTLDRPVISVGNLSVGGTGKTPMVRHVVRALIGAGRRPCVAMRGYASVEGRSDEAEEYAAAFPDVPVVARPDRTAGLLELFATPRGETVDCVVLDDGFQHRRIARRLDIVLIDATRDPFGDHLLPRGLLREPPESLGRAGAVVITHAESAGGGVVDAIAGRVAGVAPRAVMAVCRHAWDELAVLDGGAERTEPAPWIKGKAVAVCCAIGNPAPFLAAVEAVAGRAPVAEMILRDHDPYRPRTIDDLVHRLRACGAEVLVTTEKDWAKLCRVPAGAWPCRVARPRLVLRFDRGGADLDGAALAAAAGGGGVERGEGAAEGGGRSAGGAG